MDHKELLTLGEAIKRLPEGDMVHTFRQLGPVLIGANYKRNELIDAMWNAVEIEVAGPAAQAMKHGLVICDEEGALFIATGA